MNRSESLGTASLGRHLRIRLTMAALIALSLAVAVTPGVRGRLVRALSGAHRGTSLPGPLFSDPPRDDEFSRAGLFAEPLVPVGPTNRDENTQLAALLVAYSEALFHGEPDAVQPLADFTAQHPHSVWTPTLELELGAVYRRTGHFSKALTTWQSAWNASRDLTTTNGHSVGDMAAAYLSQFEAYLGRKELLAPLLEDLKTRPVRGTAAELISESSRGLAEMVSRPDVSFKCGPSALSRILEQHPTPDAPASRRILDEASSTPNGLSLTAVQAISVEAGMNYQMAHRSPGAPLILPAVVHWKVGHYAAILGRDARNRISVGDPTFGEGIALTPTTLDEEASGYFLVPPGPLQDGWRQVDADEGSTVWGRGNTGNNHDNGATGRPELQAFPPGGCGGCTTWNIEAAVVSLELRDDPIGYKPPFGPEIRFPMTYSHRDIQQPGTGMQYTNFGNKWTFDWLSYVVDDANKFYGRSIFWGYVNSSPTFIESDPSTAFCADLYRRGGGDEPFVFPNSLISNPITATITSAEGTTSQSYLTRYVDTSANHLPTYYTRALPDGSIEKFTLPLGTPGVPNVKFFMTEVDDPQGNAVKINYDSNTTRIISIVDAAGQSTTICYNDSPAPCVAPNASVNPPTHYEVTQIIDPFGRTANFGYDPLTGHLISIKDVLGITSTYQYAAAGSGEDVDFITSLTTPYGQTTFAYTDSTNSVGTTTTRSLTATETSGAGLGNIPPRTSRVEFRQGDAPACTPIATPTPDFPAGTFVDSNGIECVDGAATSNFNVPISNTLLDYRNTFIWNPAQYAVSFVTKTQPPYQAAKIIHWAHADDTNPYTASRIPESIKEPLESRVWFVYPGQAVNQLTYKSTGVGATNQPVAILRAIGDGMPRNTWNFQVWRFQYDAYGHVVQSIDPIGRTLSMTYDPANNVDLLNVTNTTTGYNDSLLTLSNYVRHRPQQVTAANGETTQLRYNAVGQLTSSTDPLTDAWTYSYTPTTGMTLPPNCGFLTGIVGPTVSVPASQGGGQQTPVYSFTRDNVGRLATEEGPDNQLLTFSYDNADRLTETVFPDLTTELRGYTFAGPPQLAGTESLDLTSFTDRMGLVTTRQYDGFRDLIEIDEPVDPITKLARITTLSYGLDGMVQTVTDPLKHPTNYTRDVRGRLQTVTNPDNSTQWLAYDVMGRVLSTSPDRAATMPGTKLYAYNFDDTIHQAFLDARAPTVFAYDPGYRRLTGWSRIQGGTWAQPTCGSGSCSVLDGESYMYWPVPRAGVVQPGANKVQQVATTIGRLSPAAIPTTATVSYVYDELNRIKHQQISTPVVSGPSGSQSVNAVESFQYDAIGRLTNDTNLLDSFTYAYNDATGRVSGRASVGGPQIAAYYFPPPQGDALLQQLSYMTTPSSGSTLLAQYGYQYDARHNVTAFFNSHEGTSRYTYDAYSQLNTATLPGGVSAPIVTALPDLSGNIVSLTTAQNINGTATSSAVSFLYDAANKAYQERATISGYVNRNVVQPISSDSTLGSLDTIGTGSSAQSYGYDQSNRLNYCSEGTPSNGTGPYGTFQYDGLGRLTQAYDGLYNATNGSNQDRANHSYLWCGQRMCLEFDNMQPAGVSGNQVTALPVTLYVGQGTVNNPALPTAAPTVAPSQLAYDITDQLGSVRAVVTNNAIVAQYGYDAFGNRSTLAGSPTASKRGFTGLYYHYATGLQFARNRVYNASLGRWMTRDPIGSGHAFGDPERFNATDLNLYAYAGNNPQSMVDPSGLTDYSAAQVQGMLDGAVAEYQQQGLASGLYNALANNSVARGNGKYDFQYTQQDDTFDVPGLWQMSSADFGNYFAGYVNYGAFGYFGELATYAGGTMLQTGQSFGNWWNGVGPMRFGDDDFDQVLIDQGAYDSWKRSESGGCGR